MIYEFCILPVKTTYKSRIKRKMIMKEHPMHEWWGLSYAQYLTVPRTVIQSMPDEWQARFKECLEEMDDTFDWRPPHRQCYKVELWELTDEYDEELGYRVDVWGRQVDDPLQDYKRGRRQL